MRIGSVLCDEQARVVELNRGWVVDCSCGGTIGRTHGFSPFDNENAAHAAARGHVEGHAKDAVDAAFGLVQLGAAAGIGVER